MPGALLKAMSEQPRPEDMTVTIAEAIVEAAFILRRTGVAEARREAGSLLAHVTARDRAFLITHAADALAAPEFVLFRKAVARRAAGEPLQYITGHQEFYGLDFEVTRDVLIPRPETELLVETARDLLAEADPQPPVICDVGTGSGCIAVALLREHAPDARAIGIDISVAALRLAARNAVRHSVRARLALLASDCFSALDPASARFTIIVSNPPYVPEEDLPGVQREVREHEPRVALTPGGDGLGVIRRLLTDAPQFLVAGGHLVFEIGFNQQSAVADLVDPRVWTLLDVHPDLQGIPRIVALRRAN